MKKIVYTDLDGTAADFNGYLRILRRGMPQKPIVYNPPEMYVPGFFLNLPLIPGAKDAIDTLLTFKGLDLFVASQPVATSPISAKEKYEWVTQHFPSLTHKIFMTCDKTHLLGDYLIDDDPKWTLFKGTFLLMTQDNTEACWKTIVDQLSIYKDEV